ncbi:MAG: hypothetical protein IPL60_10395 [Ardenticatenia bacterium]|nr:hypothetical protein [Ardenticatenia bacterium]
MQQAVEDGDEDQAGGDEEDQAGVQGVERGEELARRGLDVVDGPHAAQEHGGVELGVDPEQAAQVVVARGAGRPGAPDAQNGEADMPQHPQQEGPAGEKRLAAMLVHPDLPS